MPMPVVMVSRHRLLQPLTAQLPPTLGRLQGLHWASPSLSPPRHSRLRTRAQMADAISPKVIDSHVHVWASPQRAAEKYPYFPGQEPTLTGHVDFLLQCMEEAGVDGALIVQPINHKFDHSYVTSVLNQYPSKFVGCCLSNPAEDGTGIKQLEDLISKDGYRAVRFNPYLWPSGELMTNEVVKAMFAKAGELGAPVGFMCMKGLDLHLSETHHSSQWSPFRNYDEEQTFSKLLNLSRFPQGKVFPILHKIYEQDLLNYIQSVKVYIKFSALFRVSRNPYPYEDLADALSKIVSSYGANRIMW